MKVPPKDPKQTERIVMYSPATKFVRLKNQATTEHKASPGALSIIHEGAT